MTITSPSRTCRLDPAKRRFGGFGSPNGAARFFGCSPDGRFYFFVHDGNKRALTITPNSLTENKIEGAVLVLIDINQLKKS